MTATDHTKANIALNTVISMFSQYCKEPFTVEEVEVLYDDRKEIYPRLNHRKVKLDVNYTNTLIGIKETPETMQKYLKKMGMNSDILDQNTLEVDVDAIRTDILHPCDLAEDIAIAHDFNKVNNVPVPTATVGTQ